MWADHAIWWQVYPLGFTGAEPDARTPIVHRLDQLENWLDYAVELGCSGLLLGPVFASETHGYDTVDHFRIDPRLGDDDDFDRLVAAAHARGLRVALDGVFNHVAAFLRCAGRLVPPRTRTARSTPSKVTSTWSRSTTVSPRSRSTSTDVLSHWLDRGVDGWRLDAAYAVPPDFWRAAAAARAVPGRVVLR